MKQYKIPPGFKAKFDHDLYHIFNTSENNLRKKVINALNKFSFEYECLLPNCNELAINSHEISMKNVINDFTNHKKLKGIQPEFSENIKKDKLKEIPVKRASTFKGFCKKHDEEIFKYIDTTKQLDQKYVFFLYFRSIHFELFKYKAQKDLIDKTFNRTFYNYIMNKEKIDDNYFIIKEINNKIEVGEPPNGNEVDVVLNEIIKYINSNYSTYFSQHQLFKITSRLIKQLSTLDYRIFYIVYNIESYVLFSHIHKNRISDMGIFITSINGVMRLIIGTRSKIIYNLMNKQSIEYIQRFIVRIIHNNKDKIFFENCVNRDLLGLNQYPLLENYSYSPINEFIDPIIRIKGKINDT